MAPLILIVDENPKIRELLAEYLEDTGFEVATADDGPEALALCADRRPDLVLVDVDTARVATPEFVGRLREYGLASRIAGMSAGSPDMQVPPGLATAGYLAKPFNLDELVDLVHRTVDQDHDAGGSYLARPTAHPLSDSTDGPRAG